MTRFRLLGPLEVLVGDDWRAIGAPKWRSVLAALLIHPGQIVSVATLISEVWGDEPPARAANLVSIYVLRLRRLIGDADNAVLVTRAPGYQLRVSTQDTDALLFEDMVRDGRRAYGAGDPQAAASLLTEALGLWHGRPLADVPPTPLVEAEAERLSELRLGAAELRITAELALGGYHQAVAELRRLLADHPLREGLWLLLMRALDGAGRHAEALEVYGRAREAISAQLGVDPGAELRQLHAELLAKDSAVPGGVISAGSVPAGTAAAQPATPETEREEPRRGGRGAEPPPAQLPADVVDFTGRDEQVERLADLLSHAAEAAGSDPGAVRIAVVAGTGGLGKTSLAVHAAHRVRGSFPDGQLYVDLLGATPNPVPPGDVLARFLRDLGVDGRDIGVDEAERAGRYRTVLAGRRMLVVLDNARDAAQVRPLLPGTASSAVLVTTRSRMPDLASTRLVDLNVLDDHDALKLFVKVVGEERAAAEPEATAELLEACAGLPLAIRICAARLATRSGWTIAAMAARLRDVHRRLDEMRAGDLAVRASFQVSFASLPASTGAGGIDPARAFCLLGLWSGSSISSAAAAAMFGVPEYSAEDALGVLVDTHLLDCVGPDRYRFHDLLRVYAAERAGESEPAAGRAAAVTRLLTWYMRAADTAATALAPHRFNIPLDDAAEADAQPPAFAGAEDALAWYDGERANIVAATRQAAASGRHEIAWRLPAPLYLIFNSRGNWADCIATHRIALDSARQAGNRQGEAWVLNTLGLALGVTGETESIGYLEQALDIRREVGDRIGEAQAANNLADAYEALGRGEEVIGLLHRALDLNREAGHEYGEAVNLGNLGSALLNLGRLEEAIGVLRQSRDAFGRIGYPDGAGYALHNLGRSFLALGRDADAVDSLRQALASHRAAGNRNRQAVTLRSLAQAQAQAGEPGPACESWSAAAAIFDDLGDSVRAAEVRAEQDASGIC
ncbi:MAG TPA: BTAD domain-containing putative transcriptional regulator [Streptosporangiaceae bacterium]|nr:BTAD domain-containing putative transcriptional regulator [Streptosporangiaceae bacterium]